MRFSTPPSPPPGPPVPPQPVEATPPALSDSTLPLPQADDGPPIGPAQEPRIEPEPAAAGAPMSAPAPTASAPEGPTMVERAVASSAASAAAAGAPAEVEAPAVIAAAAPAGAPIGTASVFLPVLIMLLSTGAWSTFQLMQLRAETEALKTMHANQEAPLKQAQRVRDGLDNLAQRTRALSDGGNTNARAVIEELAKRGVMIKPAEAGASGAGK